MKITIKDEKKPEEPSMELFLENTSDGVRLRGIDSNRKYWSILRVTEEGIELFPLITEESGWPLDSDGKLKLVK